MSQLAQRWRRRGGFTLAEVMFVIAIGSFVLGGVWASYTFTVRGFRSLAAHAEMQADGRRAIDWFGRDARTAIHARSVTATQIVFALPAVTLTNGVIAATNIVTHSFASGVWRRADTVPGRSLTLANDVGSLEFLVFDLAGAPTALATNAASAQVAVDLDRVVGQRAQRATTLSARFVMRNRR